VPKKITTIIADDGNAEEAKKLPVAVPKVKANGKVDDKRNDTVDGKVKNKVAVQSKKISPARKHMLELVKKLKKLCPLSKACLIIDDLKKNLGRLVIIDIAQIEEHSSVIDQIAKVLDIYKVAAPDINRHACMLQKLLYFKQAVHDDSNWKYGKLNPIVKAAAVAFADVTWISLPCNDRWQNYEKVSGNYEVPLHINIISRRQKAVFNMEAKLDAREDSDEDDDEQPWYEWFLEQRNLCIEYVEALNVFSDILPKDIPTLVPLKAYYESEHKAVCDALIKGASNVALLAAGCDSEEEL
jgi:hypothetical protein